MQLAKRGGVQRSLVALALSLLATCLWALTHRYLGLTGDAELYALQALARLQPALAGDVYLRDVSQDHYTIFSHLYAWLIGVVGMQQAARDLYFVFSAWLLVASWALVRRLAGSTSAWLAVALLSVMVGHYGSYGVFRFSESFLTARTIAEALVITAVACWYGGYRLLGVAIAVSALPVHPLLALPGLLLLLCLWTGPRLALAGALAGVAGTALLAVVAVHAQRSSGPFALIDGDWLEMVRERSQFLFLQLWRLPDWKSNLLPFASLALTLLAVEERRIRDLAWSAMLVGAAGLAVAWIAGTVGPVAILIQGQAWRWVWIAAFMGIALLAPTLRALWRDPRCGPACAGILAAGWTCAAVDTWIGIGLAALLWLSRPWLTPRLTMQLRYAAVGLALVLGGWTVANVWTTLGAPSPEDGREPVLLAYARNLLGMQTVSLPLFGLLCWWLRRQQQLWVPALACLVLLPLALLAVPGALHTTLATEDSVAYASWRAAIPPGASVWVAGEHNAAGFVWFTLQRPNYLSVDQSAGVVFSRATAAEIRRRSEVLEPVERPSWRIMSFIAHHTADKGKAAEQEPPLTVANLTRVCGDPQLGFVVARAALGFGGLQSKARGHYQNWYLYDCRQVRAAAGSA